MSCRLPGWWVAPPRRENRQPEHGVRKHEDPGGCLVEQQGLDPVLDEALAVSRLARADTEPGFERGERADLTQPRLCNDDSDSCDMNQPEPQAVDPWPAAEPVSCHDSHQAANDEEDDGEMHHEHGIGQELVRHNCPPLRGLTPEPNVEVEALAEVC